MVLSTLLCILLSFAAIVSPGQYTMQEIDTIESNNQNAVDLIHADPVQEQAIINQYTSDLEWIVIIDMDQQL